MDDLVITTNWSFGGAKKAYVVFGGTRNLGNSFPARRQAVVLDGSNGFAIPGPARDELTGGGRQRPRPRQSDVLGTGSATS